MMRDVARNVTTLLFAACCLAPNVGLAESYQQFYIRVCHNGPQIAALSHQYERARALLDDNRYTIAKKIAVELYDCSTTTSDPDAHDVAKFFSLQFLAISAVKRDFEAIAIQCNELAATTKFPDIRKLALKLRDELRSD